MKIYIIGPAGSGKTTLGKKLSDILKITHTDLDEIFWDNNKKNFGTKRDEQSRNSMFKEVLNQESWIIEGAYLKWPQEGFSLADKIIFLDINSYILTYRIVKRFIKRKLGLDHCKKKESINSLFKLLKWNKNQGLLMKEFFENYDLTNLIHISNIRELDSIVFPAKMFL